MHEMEEGTRSDGGLVKKKKKNSSGCLVIKKNGQGKSGSRKVFESNNKKKGSRLVLSDSESSEESLEQFNRNVVAEDNGIRNSENESERKRRLDVFEFDEYDGIDEKRMRMDFSQDRVKLSWRSESERKPGIGSSRLVVIDKTKHFDRISNSSGGRKDLADYTVKSRLKIEDDDGDLPISSLRQKCRVTSDEHIRLQGKNGVLKVMVNKKKKMELPKKFNTSPLEDRKVSESEKVITKNKSFGPSFYSDSKRHNVRMEKRGLKVGKSTMTETRSSSKGIKRESKVQLAGKVTPIKENESKVERGSGTEKQLLREKIKNILVNAGWKIDYRPRRNRDYLDAVYISPAGSGYWSIVKAYDAFQKHMEDNVEIEPLSEEISKLTRKTQKKIEREKKMKQKGNIRNKNHKRVFSEESDEETDGDEDEDDKISFPTKKNGESLKRKSNETCSLSGDDSIGVFYKGSSKKKKVGKLLKGTDSHLLQAKRSRKIGRCTLLVRSSDKGLNSESEGYIPYTGKRTLLSWLIDSGTVNSSEKVRYMNRRQTRVLLEGWITRGGIHCGCCSKVLSVSKFEIHAGSKLRQPFQNIYLESGVSLLQCQIDAWNRQEYSERHGFHTVDIDGDDPNDDTCSLCGDGGDLICCDGCPSTFHQSCLDIKMLPPGDWHCPNCTCKFCGIGGGSSANENGTSVNVLLTCGLCEKKYHESCSQEADVLSNSSRSSISFCEPKCLKLFDHLQKLLGVKHDLDAGFTWSLIHRTDLNVDATHRTFPQRVESNSKLAVALSVMDECFLPIVDRRSGINLVNSVLYNCGSNFSRLDYSGFYTVILERSDEIISAASIRIRGTQLAEMPFIGTRHIYRRQGMCRRLLGAIELVLGSLKVEKLIIPAIAEHMHTWTAVFGFNPLDESHKQELRSMNMLTFPGIDMLQKFMVKQKTTYGDITANSGGGSILPTDNHHLAPDTEKKSDVGSLTGHDPNTCDDIALHNVNEMKEKGAVVDPSLQDSAAPLNVITSEKFNGVEDPVSPLSPHCSDLLDVRPTTDANQLDAHETESKLDEAVKVSEAVVVPDSRADAAENVVPSNARSDNGDALETVSEIAPLSLHCTDRLDVVPTTDSSQLDAQSKLDEAVNVSEAVVVPDSRADPADNMVLSNARSDNGDALETVSEIAPPSPHCTGQVDVGPTTDSNQLDPHETESKLDEAVEVSDAMASPDLRADPADNMVPSNAMGDSGDALETVSEIAPLSPHCAGRLDVESMTYSNQLDAHETESKLDETVKVSEALVIPDSRADPTDNMVPSTATTDSSNALATVSEVKPTTDSNQLVAHETENKLNKAVNVSDTVVVPDSRADPAENIDPSATGSHSSDALETVSEIASDKAVADSSINVDDLNSTKETKDKVNSCEVESDSHVGSVVSSEVKVKPVKDDFLPCADGDIDDGHKINGKVACVQPVLDCLPEIPVQNKNIKGDEGPLSVSNTYNDGTTS